MKLRRDEEYNAYLLRLHVCRTSWEESRLLFDVRIVVLTRREEAHVAGQTTR